MRLLSALLVGLCLASVPVFAADPDPPTTSIVADDVTITATGVAPAVAPAPGVIVDDGTLVAGTVGEIAAIITNYKASGAFIIAALIIAALLKFLTKHGGVARLLESTGKTWIRPVLSVVTGAVGALASTLALGIRDPVSLIAALVAGIGAGLGASGGVDFLRATLFPSSRTTHSVQEADLVVSAEALEDKVRRSTTDSAAEQREAFAAIYEAKRLAPAKRVEALAALLKAKA